MKESVKETEKEQPDKRKMQSGTAPEGKPEEDKSASDLAIFLMIEITHSPRGSDP